MRRQPYSVVLFDEVEKAHPDVFNVLLQLLDDGRVTDAQGRTVDFKNTIVILTSNIGSDLILGAKGEDVEDLVPTLMERLRAHFRPEFLNRIDETIVFHRLDQTELRQIIELILDGTRRQLHAQNVELDITEEAVDWLADKGYQPEFGARHTTADHPEGARQPARRAAAVRRTRTGGHREGVRERRPRTRRRASRQG